MIYEFHSSPPHSVPSAGFSAGLPSADHSLDSVQSPVAAAAGAAAAGAGSPLAHCISIL